MTQILDDNNDAVLTVRTAKLVSIERLSDTPTASSPSGPSAHRRKPVFPRENANVRPDSVPTRWLYRCPHQRSAGQLHAVANALILARNPSRTPPEPVARAPS
jgi:ABC-type glutathione transport system ATPase component